MYMETDTVHAPSDTLRTWKWSPIPKGTCPCRHLRDLEVVPHPQLLDIVLVTNRVQMRAQDKIRQLFGSGLRSPFIWCFQK